MNRTCRVGVHGRNNENFEEKDYQVIRESRIEAVKMMSQTRPQVLERIKKENGDIEIITRLYDGANVGKDHHPTPAEFAGRMIPIMKDYQPFCKKFHLLNEPNHIHRYEGWGANDDDARNFNTWFLEAYDRLKQAHPWASLGFPGLALPDAGAHRDRSWLNICRPAIEKADWLGCHCYWQTPPGQGSMVFNEAFGLNFKYYHQQYPDKTIEILECGNSNIQNGFPISDEDVAREFTDWLQEVFKYPYINSAAYFILSSQDRGNWEFFAWRKEDGYVKPIAHRVGQLARPERSKVQLTPPAPPVQPTAPAQPAPTPVDTTPTPTGITNQNMVDAFYSVGKALGVEPAPWGLLSKSGLTLGELIGNREAIYSGLSLAQLNLSPDERRLMREELSEYSSSGEALEANFTNQNVIDACYTAGRKMGLPDWDLLGKAGLSLGALASDRNSNYNGPRISKANGLSEAEKSAIKQELKSILGLSESEELPSFAIGDSRDRYLKDEAALIGIPAAMPKHEHLAVDKADSKIAKRVCQIWNNYGWALTMIADNLGVELPLVVAVVASESLTHGLDSKGQMIIRFEVHIFKDKLNNEATFSQHFQCDPHAPWQEHQWRANAEAEWQNVHTSQTSEQGAFALARSLDEDAAKLSISMGLSEILGCNYAAIGYNNVSDMYNALASTERLQLIAIFDLIAGPNAVSRRVDALRNKDIDTFAALHKSGGEAAKYGAMLRQAVATFNELKAA